MLTQKSDKKILLVGNFLSGSKRNKSIPEFLYGLLASRGWQVYRTSTYVNRALRLADMVWQTWKHRNSYKVANIAVFSGASFFWAEVVSLLLQWLKKPYVITLHGGNLPSFALQNPVRVRKLLSSASRVTSPSYYLQKEFHKYRRDIIYLPNGLVIQNYPFRTPRSNSHKICWLRAFHNIYNPEMAVETLALLVDEYPDIRLTMMGPDMGEGKLEEIKRFAERTVF